MWLRPRCQVPGAARVGDPRILSAGDPPEPRADVDGDTFIVVLDQVHPRGAVGDLLVVPEDAPGVDVVEGGLISSSVARI
jgi:hypothetical protein